MKNIIKKLVTFAKDKKKDKKNKGGTGSEYFDYRMA